MVRSEIIERVLPNDTLPASAKARWFWTITCVSRLVGVTKSSKTDAGFVHTKEEAIAALRAAWAPERDWSTEVRVLTSLSRRTLPALCRDSGVGGLRPTGLRRDGVLKGFAQELGLGAVVAWEIYKAFRQETEPSQVNRDEWLTKVRKRMLASA